jgi:fructan beta-fructosidase
LIENHQKNEKMNQKLSFFCAIVVFFACHAAPKIVSKPTELHRPQFHFTPPAHWMNDPNGMVFFEGEYHLFYQYYPDSTVWGPMHWGHAVSKDLVNWGHLPIALFPDSLGYIFSGSAVVDWENKSGFGLQGLDAKPPLVAIFTHHLMSGEKAGRHDFQYQSIAYSNDRGRTWTKYAGNPVIPNLEKVHNFRDPKIIWDDRSKQWIVVFAAGNHVKFWASSDLKTWQYLSDFGEKYGSHDGVWECPDIFQIPVENSNEKRWVLLQSMNPGAPNGGSGTQYFVGNFDGKTFTLDPDFSKSVENGKAIWLDCGRDNYAGVTWSDVPKSDGRRLFLGWMSNWDYAMQVPTEKWRSAMTLPRTLILKKTAAGFRLFSQPIRELEKLRKLTHIIDNQAFTGEIDLSKKTNCQSPTFELELEIELLAGAKSEFAVVVSNSKNEKFRIGFDAVKNEYFSDRTKSGNINFSAKFAQKRAVAPRTSKGETIKMHLFFDVASCELFADDGETTMTDIFFPSEDFSKIGLAVEGEKVTILNGKLFEFGIK